MKINSKEVAKSITNLMIDVDSSLHDYLDSHRGLLQELADVYVAYLKGTGPMNLHELSSLAASATGQTLLKPFYERQTQHLTNEHPRIIAFLAIFAMEVEAHYVKAMASDTTEISDPATLAYARNFTYGLVIEHLRLTNVQDPRMTRITLMAEGAFEKAIALRKDPLFNTEYSEFEAAAIPKIHDLLTDLVVPTIYKRLRATK